MMMRLFELCNEHQALQCFESSHWRFVKDQNGEGNNWHDFMSTCIFNDDFHSLEEHTIIKNKFFFTKQKPIFLKWSVDRRFFFAIQLFLMWRNIFFHSKQEKNNLSRPFLKDVVAFLLIQVLFVLFLVFKFCQIRKNHLTKFQTIHRQLQTILCHFFLLQNTYNNQLKLKTQITVNRNHK